MISVSETIFSLQQLTGKRISSQRVYMSFFSHNLFIRLSAGAIHLILSWMLNIDEARRLEILLQI